MRSNWMLCVVLGMAALADAKDPKPYQTGRLQQMDSVQCGAAQKGAQISAGEMTGTDSASKQAQPPICQEYILQAERVTYRIRPRDERHAVLLPVGEPTQFRLENDKMLLRVPDLDGRERAYIVISISPRSDSSTADAAPARLNHLQ
jgi:hypothetical protein